MLEYQGRITKKKLIELLQDSINVYGDKHTIYIVDSETGEEVLNHFVEREPGYIYLSYDPDITDL